MTTRTLWDDARLTDEEITNLLPIEVRHFTVGGIPYRPDSPDVADAATRKALRVVAQVLREGRLSKDAPDGARLHEAGLAEWLEQEAKHG